MSKSKQSRSSVTASEVGKEFAKRVGVVAHRRIGKSSKKATKFDKIVPIVHRSVKMGAAASVASHCVPNDK